MRPVFFSSVILAYSSAILIAPSLAYAQATDIATRLLEEAKQLNQEGKLAEACPLLDRSYVHDAKDGVLFARADCWDQVNKIAKAAQLYAAYFRAYNRMTGTTKDNHAERAAIAEKRIEELTPRIPTIKFIWADAPPPNTKIRVDGDEYPASTLESRLPLEPGPHEIVVQLPNEPERLRKVTLTEGNSTIVDLTPLPPQKTPDAISLDKLLAPDKLTTRPVAVKPRNVADSTVDVGKISGFVGLGLGAAGVVAGSIFGYWALQEKYTMDAHCDAQYTCDRTGMDASRRVVPLANTSTALFLTGGVVLGVGATLLIVAYRQPSHKASAALHVHVGPNQAQLGITGAF